MTQTSLESQVLTQMKLEQQPEFNFKYSCYSPENPPIILGSEVEITKKEDDDFGTLYKVSKNWKLLGTYYQDLKGKWVVQVEGELEISDKRFLTEEQAILIIVAVTGNLVADVA